MQKIHQKQIKTKIKIIKNGLIGQIDNKKLIRKNNEKMRNQMLKETFNHKEKNAFLEINNDENFNFSAKIDDDNIAQTSAKNLQLIYRKIFEYFAIKIESFTIPKNKTFIYQNIISYLSSKINRFLGEELSKNLDLQIHFLEYKEGIFIDKQPHENIEITNNTFIKIESYLLSWQHIFSIKMKLSDGWGVIEKDWKNYTNQLTTDEANKVDFLYEGIKKIISMRKIDLEKKYSVNNTWNDLVELIKSKMKKAGLSSQVINLINFNTSNNWVNDFIYNDDSFTPNYICKLMKFEVEISERLKHQSMINICFENMVFDYFYLKKITKYLNNFSSWSTAYSLNGKIDSEDNWWAVWAILKNDLISKRIVEKTIIDKISITNAYYKNMYTQLWNDKLENDKIFKNFLFKLNESSIKKIIFFEKINWNEKSYFNRAVEKVENWNKENRFSLYGLTNLHTFKNALEKVKSNCKSRDFQGIEWTSVTSSQKTLGGDDDFQNYQQYHIIKLNKKSTNQETDKFNIYYRDIQDAWETLAKAMDKVRSFNNSNRFDLSGVNKTNSFGTALGRVKRYFENDQVFKHVEWISVTNAKKTLNDADYNNGNQYHVLRLKIMDYQSIEINISYKNIANK